MITTLVFSRDRACQLDLLLRSIERRAALLEHEVKVVWTATMRAYEDAYLKCIDQHQNMTFIKESGFQAQVENLLLKAKSPYVMFLCDDSVFYRPLDKSPERLLYHNDNLLCVSLRLGEHTDRCYPHDCTQSRPPFSYLENARAWWWKDAEYDFGYPGSLDGHVFRKGQARALLATGSYANPNQMEEVLNRGCRSSSLLMMACYKQSFLVNTPVNRVNLTHPNRFGVKHVHSEEELNDQFLQGRRLSLDDMDFRDIRAAHHETALVFM